MNNADLDHMQKLLHTRAIKKLTRVISPVGGYTMPWPMVVNRLANHTVKRGSNCGRMLALEIDGFYFEFRDGAHNTYSFVEYTRDEFDTLLNDITSIIKC